MYINIHVALERIMLKTLILFCLDPDASVYSLNSIIRPPMTSEFWTELRRGPNYRVKTVLVIEL
jgi:hypothetical protein